MILLIGYIQNIPVFNNQYFKIPTQNKTQFFRTSKSSVFYFVPLTIQVQRFFIFKVIAYYNLVFIKSNQIATSYFILFFHKTLNSPKLCYIIEVIVAKTFSLVRYAKFLCFGSYNCYYVKYPLIQRAHPNIKPHFELIMNIPAFLHCFYKCFFSFITTRLLILKLRFI